jgi:DNA polymerase III sliding clamp (beta) subunit (PCNA family)
MNVDRDKLLGLLNDIRPGVARKEIVDLATHFIFTGRQAITFNERICVCAPFKTDFTCSVQADAFNKLVKSLGEGDLELGLIENSEKTAMTIKGNRVDAEFAVSGGEKVEGVAKLVKDLKINTLGPLWKPLPVDFTTAIQWSLVSASEDATLASAGLTSLHFKKKTIVSSDNARVSQYTMDGAIAGDFLIPATTVEELARFQISDIAVISPWAYFKTLSGAVFCARMVHLEEGKKYGDPEPLFKFDGVDVELPKGLKEALVSAEIMAGGDYPIDKMVEINIAKGTLTVSAENDALGWIRTKVKMGVKDAPPVRFFINPGFLTQIISKTGTVKVGSDRALFQTECFKHLVSLHEGE